MVVRFSVTGPGWRAARDRRRLGKAADRPEAPARAAEGVPAGRRVSRRPVTARCSGRTCTSPGPEEPGAAACAALSGRLARAIRPAPYSPAGCRFSPDSSALARPESEVYCTFSQYLSLYIQSGRGIRSWAVSLQPAAAASWPLGWRERDHEHFWSIRSASSVVFRRSSHLGCGGGRPGRRRPAGPRRVRRKSADLR